MAIYILYTSQCLYFNYIALMQYMEKPRGYSGEYCSLEPPEGQYSRGYPKVFLPSFLLQYEYILSKNMLCLHWPFLPSFLL